MNHSASSRIPWLWGLCGSYTLLIFAMVFFGRRAEKAALEASSHWSPLPQYALCSVGALLLLFIGMRLFHTARRWVVTNRSSHSVSRLSWITAALGFAVLIYISCWMPSTLAEYAHLPIYAGLSALMSSAVCTTFEANSHSTSATRYAFVSRRPLLTVFALSNLVSLGDELLQWVHPERVFDTRDLLLNFLGTVWGVLLSKALSPSARILWARPTSI